MTHDDHELSADRITAAFADAIKAGEMGDSTDGMPNQWVFIGTYYDSDGELCTALLSNNGSRTHEALGLIALGDTVWRENARRWVLDDE